MNVKLIGFEHKAGEFESDGRKIKYDNYNLRLTQKAEGDEQYGDEIYRIKVRAQDIRPQTTANDLARRIGTIINVDIALKPDGTTKVIVHLS